MANWVVELLSGRRLSRRGRQLLLQSNSSSHDDNNHKDNYEKQHAAGLSPPSVSSPVPDAAADSTSGSDAASTSSVVVSVLPDEEDLLNQHQQHTDDNTFGASPTRAPSLKIKSLEESLRCSYRSSCSSSALSCCPPSSSSPNHQHHKAVAMSTVTIHYHGQVLGEPTHIPTTVARTTTNNNEPQPKRPQPATRGSGGVPIALGWNRLDSETFATVDQYEQQRLSHNTERQRQRRHNKNLPPKHNNSNYHNKNKKCLRLSQRTREQLLRRQGVTASEIRAAKQKQKQQQHEQQPHKDGPLQSSSFSSLPLSLSFLSKEDVQPCTILQRAGTLAQGMEDDIVVSTEPVATHDHGKNGSVRRTSAGLIKSLSKISSTMHSSFAVATTTTSATTTTTRTASSF